MVRGKERNLGDVPCSINGAFSTEEEAMDFAEELELRGGMVSVSKEIYHSETYTISLVSFDKEKMPSLVAWVFSEFNLGLGEAKELVEKCPCVLSRNLSIE